MELNKCIAAEAAELAHQFWAEAEAALDAEIARIRMVLLAQGAPSFAHEPRDGQVSPDVQTPLASVAAWGVTGERETGLYWSRGTGCPAQQEDIVELRRRSCPGGTAVR
jgi:hypothetical protein